jgi:hypothetical protein
MSESDHANDFIKRIGELSAENKGYRLKASKYKGEAEAARKEADEWKAKMEASVKDAETWRAKAESTPSEMKGKIDELTKQLRMRDHKDAWKEVAADLAEKVSVESLWKLIGHDPASSDVDVEAVKTMVDAAKAEHPYLFKGADAPAGEPPVNGSSAHRALQNGLGGGRGALDTSSSRFTVRSSDLSNPEWMRMNQSAYVKACTEGTITLVD